MRHPEFRIGDIFFCGGKRWRCTDIGSRIVAAICLDGVNVVTYSPVSRRQSHSRLGAEKADSEGWFKGPPYAVTESVFDEYDQKGCSTEEESSTSEEPDATGHD